MEIHIEKYGVEVQCIVKDTLDYEYIVKKFKRYITNNRSVSCTKDY